MKTNEAKSIVRGIARDAAFRIGRAREIRRGYGENRTAQDEDVAARALVSAARQVAFDLGLRKNYGASSRSAFATKTRTASSSLRLVLRAQKRQHRKFMHLTLHPCPHCGSPQAQTIHDLERHTVFVLCSACNASGPVVPDVTLSSHESAQRAWNLRSRVLCRTTRKSGRIDFVVDHYALTAYTQHTPMKQILIDFALTVVLFASLLALYIMTP